MVQNGCVAALRSINFWFLEFNPSTVMREGTCRPLNSIKSLSLSGLETYHVSYIYYLFRQVAHKFAGPRLQSPTR